MRQTSCKERSASKNITPAFAAQLPPCSGSMTSNGRPASSTLLKKRSGSFFMVCVAQIIVYPDRSGNIFSWRISTQQSHSSLYRWFIRTLPHVALAWIRHFVSTSTNRLHLYTCIRFIDGDFARIWMPTQHGRNAVHLLFWSIWRSQ